MFGQFLKEAANVVGDALEEQQRNSASSGGGGGKRAAGSSQVSAEDVELDDGSNIPLSTCDGNKKSLFIGINYVGTQAELRGCINDVDNIKKFVVENFNFPTDAAHMKTLVDNDPQNMPTRDNIISGCKWLVDGAKSGDSLFFHYSGHGGSQKDDTGDEVDGKDETICPVDYATAGVIVDDDLHALLVASLPEGVRLTAIMDCCHSGSVFDLPYSYKPDGNLEVEEIDNRKAAMEAALSAGMALFKGDKKTALTTGFRALTLYASDPGETNEAAKEKQIKIRSSVADVIQFSGCRDEQTSADANIGGEASGAMSWSFREAFAKNGFDQTYTQLLGNIRTLLNGKYTQVPQMSTGHRMMDLKTTKFIM